MLIAMINRDIKLSRSFSDPPCSILIGGPGSIDRLVIDSLPKDHGGTAQGGKISFSSEIVGNAPHDGDLIGLANIALWQERFLLP
jgi:hypothetical protein